MAISKRLRWAPVLLAGGLALGACSSDVTPDADGNYVGVVTSVGEDTLRMDVDSGGDIRVDTFAVCGDATASFISVGDRLTVTANREAVDFDATAILNEAGQPACESAPATDDEATSDSASGGDSAAGVVSQQEAEEAALAAVGDGTVTWSGPEDDRGAAWEVEVTRSDGSEVDVLVAADGSIVKQVDKYSGDADDGASALPSGGGEISLQDAEQVALAAVGEGTVTWSGREDERGAAFEIEVTRNDGSEIDVLIDAQGNIVN